MDELELVYNDIILEHYQNPYNKKSPDKYNFKEEGQNPLCGDQITLFLLVENNKIEDISFQGQGCSISIASSSILTSMIKGLSVKDALNLTEKSIEYIKTGKNNSNDTNDPIFSIFKDSDILAFSNIHKFPVRIKCALLSWITLKNILEKISST